MNLDIKRVFLLSAHLLCCEVAGTHIYAAGSVIITLLSNEAVCVDTRGIGVCDELHLDPSMTHVVTQLIKQYNAPIIISITSIIVVSQLLEYNFILLK